MPIGSKPSHPRPAPAPPPPPPNVPVGYPGGGDPAQDQDGSNIKKNDNYIHTIGIFKKVL